MSDSPEIAELKAEVAALSAVVAAMFGSLRNQDAQGSAEWLARYAGAVQSDADPERVTRMVDRIARQGSEASARVLRELAR
jgi:hypothetical protein